MSKLIYGINPLAISHVSIGTGHRFGTHPYKDMLYRRKHPILFALFGGYENDFDGWRDPLVVIYGKRKLLRMIRCKSNLEARTIRRDIEEKMDAFLSDISNNKNFIEEEPKWK